VNKEMTRDRMTVEIKLRVTLADGWSDASQLHTNLVRDQYRGPLSAIADSPI
jgi:hypothetical protein